MRTTGSGCAVFCHVKKLKVVFDMIDVTIENKNNKIVYL